nr:zinc finger MYM-type protein 1-like [Hydra vulgaris]
MVQKKSSGAQNRAKATKKVAEEAKNKQTLEDMGFITITQTKENASFPDLSYNDHDSQSVYECQKEPISSPSLLRSPAALKMCNLQGCGSVGISNNSPEAELNEFQRDSLESEGGTLSNREECNAQPDLVTINADPSLWPVVLCQKDRDVIILKGPPTHSLKQRDYPRDSKKRIFPLNVFYQSLPNKEKVERDFLVWSSISKALYCFPCSLLGTKAAFKCGESSLLRWNGGARDQWRKLIDCVKQHQSSSLHQKFYMDLKDAYIRLTSSTGIDSELQKQINSETGKCRTILRGILDVTLFLASRNLAFLGKTTHVNGKGNGNFLAGMELIGRHNPVIASHLEDVRRHQQEGSRMSAHYFSPTSQNEFIKECGGVIRSAAVKEIQDGIYFTIIVDGTPDTFHTEQITFVIRFLLYEKETNCWQIKERFLCVEAFEKKKGLDIAKLITDVIARLGLNIQNCRGQGYDNGYNMSGAYKGAQALIRQNYSEALYVPCSAHNLNLADVHAVESAIEIKIEFKPLEIKPLAKRPREMLAALKNAMENLDLTSEQLSQAKALKKWLSTFEFVLLITNWYKTLTAVNDVSRLLQSEAITIDDELRLIRQLLEDLKQIRGSWLQIFQNAIAVAGPLGFETELATKRKRKLKRFHNEASNTVYFHDSQTKEFKVNVFNVALDSLIQQIDSRFEASQDGCQYVFIHLVGQ